MKKKRFPETQITAVLKEVGSCQDRPRGLPAAQHQPVGVLSLEAEGRPDGGFRGEAA